MSLVASFTEDRATAHLGGPTSLSLRLVNPEEVGVVVKLSPTGACADRVTVQVETVYLDPGETFDLPVVFDVGGDLAAGEHSCAVSVTPDGGEPLTVSAAIEVPGVSAYRATIDPALSHSSSAGVHRLVVENTGNTPVAVELTPDATADTEIEIAAPLVNVEPGRAVNVELRVSARERFWRGAPRRHDFAVDVRGPDESVERLIASFEQEPRLRPWLLPALVGAIGGLLLSTIAWFVLWRPMTQGIADDAADDAIVADREALQERIAELEAAAAEAEELPLGQPTDLRLDASAAPGEAVVESFTVTGGRVLSITDVVFQNPTGAAGSIALRRDGDVVLRSNLANFRDLDFHFVAPFRFTAGATIELEVVCEAPGPATASCDVGAALTGFADEDR